ncbi:MAG: GDP-mannose 4,6-dehydratase [Euryarchaeota archaeon]|nr:GDP-mannose 4,6-dehydratase [Euryarchaeota archaeon]
MGRKKAIITGVTGQDGSYLSEFLLAKDYEVFGVARRSSQPVQNKRLINHLLDHPNFNVLSGDLSDQVSIDQCVKSVEPDEFYNLGAQSFVPESWRSPTYTADITGLGSLRCLEAIRAHAPECKFYQAGSSEQFGMVRESPQNEMTPFYPRSPYGCAKVFAHDITRNFRESYGMFACTGILFNHESPRRGIEFVTRKIPQTAARISLGLEEFMEIGNVNARRDWGYAEDYVEMMWKMLQTETPDDYVVATGEDKSVKDFIEAAFEHVGMELEWSGEGLETTATDQDGVVRVKTNPDFYRPAEVDLLLGDPSKAAEKLGWVPKTDFKDLVLMMIENDLELQKAGMA